MHQEPAARHHRKAFFEDLGAHGEHLELDAAEFRGAGELLLGGVALTQRHGHKLADDALLHTTAVEPRLLGHNQVVLRIAAQAGGAEIDMVINIGKALGGDWDYVNREIKAINDVVTANKAILKVIFENDYLNDAQIIRLCKICSSIGVAFIKTSTGYGFVKQPDGSYNYKGATVPHLKLMRQHCMANIQIKAAGGVRTLDDLLLVRSLGGTRIGATATEAILEEAKRRGIGTTPVKLSEVAGKLAGDGY